jgi:hypothetical protein
MASRVVERGGWERERQGRASVRKERRTGMESACEEREETWRDSELEAKRPRRLFAGRQGVRWREGVSGTGSRIGVSG